MKDPFLPVSDKGLKAMDMAFGAVAQLNARYRELLLDCERILAALLKRGTIDPDMWQEVEKLLNDLREDVER